MGFHKSQPVETGHEFLSSAHHLSPRAEQIVNFTLLRCKRLLQGVGARRRPQPSRHVRRKGAAPLSGAEEQTARAISAYAQCACLLSLQMGSIN
jgi:hypothetical protein